MPQLWRIPVVFILALAAGLAAAAAAGAAGYVIIESNAGAYPRGGILHPGSQILLSGGQKVTVIDESGKVEQVRGPAKTKLGKRIVGAKVGSTATALSRLIQQDVGAGPGVPGKTVPSDQIDIKQGGRYCLSHGRTAKFYRAAKSRRQTLRLEDLKSGKKAKAAWPAGQASLAWPAALPPRQGGDYLIFVTGAFETVNIRLHLLPQAISNDAERLLGLHEGGCPRQAKALLEELKRRARNAP